MTHSPLYQRTIGLLSLSATLSNILLTSALATLGLYEVIGVDAATPGYTKKAYLEVASGSVGAWMDPNTSKWYSTTPMTTLRDGDSVKYVLDMASARVSLGSGALTVEDMIALGHTGISLPQIPYLWTGATTPSLGVPTTIAGWSPTSQIIPTLSSGGILAWRADMQSQDGYLSGVVSGNVNPLTLSGIQSLAGLNSTTTDGFVSHTFVNSSGDVVIFAPSHGGTIQIRSANLTN
jgi:hypothetical protein